MRRGATVGEGDPRFRPPGDLRDLLRTLRDAGELVEVDAEVDPELEVAEIHRRVIAAGGPALLFRRVRGSPYRVVTNLFGTARRVELAFERPELLVHDLIRLLEELPAAAGSTGGVARTLWRARSLLGRLARLGTRHVARAPVLDVVDAPPRLTALPLTKSWSEDGGAFLTLPLVYTEPPGGGAGNLGIYRMQRFDDATTGMHWQIQKGGGFHFDAAERSGADLPVSAFLGGPPAALLSAVAPLPENVPELLLASLLLGSKLKTTRHPSSPHRLLADAEFCLVGRARAHERRPEGPFGDHYGYYSLAHDFPVFRCEAVLHRADAILPATVVGKPRQEDFHLGDFLQRLLAPLFPRVMPGVVDLWSYGETGYHSLAAAVVRDRYKREAMVAGFRILGEGQLSLTKFLLLTDGAVDLHDFKKVLEHVLARARIETDLFVFPNLSMDTLDYTGTRLNEGSKGLLLGLGEPIRTLPREFRGELPSPFERARPFCAGCLVVGGPDHAREPDAAERLAQVAALADWPLVVLSDEPDRASASSMNFLWTTFTRFDPARDLRGSSASIAKGMVVRRPPLVIDARRKHGYPAELLCDPDTAKRVTRRWIDYFSTEVPMGDSARSSLDSV